MQYPSGAFSPYGDEVRPLLQSLVDRGGLQGEHFTEVSFKAFRAYKGRLNQMPKQFIANIEAGQKWPHAGVNDNQAHSLVKVGSSRASSSGCC